MALTECKILHSIEYNFSNNTLNVEWRNEILRDTEIISSIPHRCCYAVAEKLSFIKDVGIDAEQYIALAGW